MFETILTSLRGYIGCTACESRYSILKARQGSLLKLEVTTEVERGAEGSYLSWSPVKTRTEGLMAVTFKIKF